MASIRCGSCKERHESVGDVKDCYAYMEHAEAEAQAEAEMEKRAERWWEERGGPLVDERERALWAIEGPPF